MHDNVTILQQYNIVIIYLKKSNNQTSPNGELLYNIVSYK